MALQRNLKALGTFGYQTTARRNPVYIQYIPRTLRYVATTGARSRVRAAAGAAPTTGRVPLVSSQRQLTALRR